MNNHYQKAVIFSLVIAIGIFVALPALFLYAADPCQIFHKPFMKILPHGFFDIARCQHAGLINSYLADPNEGFDSIIIGSSLSENFRPEYIPEKTGLKRTMKLSMGDPAPVEQNILAQRAISSGHIKHVYWEIFPYLYRMPEKYDFQKINLTGRFPTYLYNQSRLDDYRYIFNLSTLGESIRILLNGENNLTSIDRIGYWENICESKGICDQFYKPEDIANIQKSYNPEHRTLKQKNIVEKINYSYFDKFILDFILGKCNSDIDFDIFFPPVSMLWFSRLNAEDFDYEIYLLRHVVMKTASCKNVHVSSFMNEQWITGDLSNYHDPKHFYGQIHDFMIDAMAENRDGVTADTIDAFEKKMIGNINEYKPYGTILHPH